MEVVGAAEDAAAEADAARSGAEVAPIVDLARSASSGVTEPYRPASDTRTASASADNDHGRETPSAQRWGLALGGENRPHDTPHPNGEPRFRPPLRPPQHTQQLGGAIGLAVASTIAAIDASPCSTKAH